MTDTRPAAPPQGADASPVPAVRGGIVTRRALFARLEKAGRVTQISAPAGSGNTFLLRSWIDVAGLAERTAWVPVPSRQDDPERFWISVADALRGTVPGSSLVRELTAAPSLDGWAIVERLLNDLAALDERLWLVLDDLDQLVSAEAHRQLELLIMRAPLELRFVLSARRDLRLGLHRLRLDGQLTEIRASDLRFSLHETRVLFDGAGVELSDSALAKLHERTEGWAAGLRLAALSLAGHPDPDGFAAGFYGSDRMVADYLLAEVLERQSEEVRRLLLRTSVLERVNGELAQLMTGYPDAERVLQDLEQAGAFVVSLDARRTWFRYHQMFADLLQLELRRTAPKEVTALHRAAAGWFAGHRYPVEAIRHAQAAGDWGQAARLLSDHWVGLGLDGQAATAHALLAGFPAGTVAADAELTALAAFDELERGSLEEAERQLALATYRSGSVPGDRRGHFELTVTVLRLALARQRGNLPAVIEEAQRLLASAQDEAGHERGDDLHALALINLGIAETWAVRYEDADRHLEQGVALARRVGRPYLEILALAHWAEAAHARALPWGAQRGMQAIELARQHGWADEPVVAAAYIALGMHMLTRGRLDEAEPWLAQAERSVRPEADPVAGLMVHFGRGLLELARGHDDAALAAFSPAERLADLVVADHALATKMRAFRLHTLVRLGQEQKVEQALAAMDPRGRGTGETRVAVAALRLAQGNPEAAMAVLAPVLDGSVPIMEPRGWLAQAFLLETIACDALGDQPAAGRALERALDLADADGFMLPFFLHPAPEVLKRHAGLGTAHAATISEILYLLARPASGDGSELAAGQPGQWITPGSGGSSARESGLHEPLAASETRVLRYLPTNLRVPEIASELSLSVHTVRTHIRHLYEKLGAHSRSQAVDRARALGLIAPSARRP